MKYKEIFSKWYFWLVVIVISISNFYSVQPVLIGEYIGMFVGSLFVTLIFASIIWLIGKLFKKIGGKE